MVTTLVIVLVMLVIAICLLGYMDSKEIRQLKKQRRAYESLISQYEPIRQVLKLKASQEEPPGKPIIYHSKRHKPKITVETPKEGG